MKKKVIISITSVFIILLLTIFFAIESPVLNKIFVNSLTNQVSEEVEEDSEDIIISDEITGEVEDCLAGNSVVITYENAKIIYNQTNTFNHVDIRVNGTFNENGVQYNIKIANAKLTVVNGEKTIVNKTYTNNDETYEWRATGIAVPKSAKIILVFDIILDGKTVREDYTMTYEGEEAFIQAIVDCDMHWGLDFKIDAKEIINVVLPNVSYQWTSLPEGLATLPETVLGYNKGETHTIQTTITEGTYVVDEQNGKIYTFEGWKEWSSATDSHATKNAIANNQVPITGDTIIYGEWTSKDLEYQASYIDLATIFVNNESNIPKDLYYTITTPSGAKEKISYSLFKDNKTSINIETEGNYTIEQHNSNILGFKLSSTNITTSLPTISNENNKIIISADLNYKLPTDAQTPVKIGEVIYTNKYEKKIGQSIHNYPDLEINVADSKTKEHLSNATFTLTPKNSEKTPIASTPTNKNGSTKLKNIESGDYTLTQTIAPTNYHLNNTEYNITIKNNDSIIEQYNAKTDAYDLIYNYVIEITPNDHYDINNSKLTVLNDEIMGFLFISTEFGQTSDITTNNFPTTSKINIQVTNEDGYKEIITLDSTNNWTTKIANLKLGTYQIKQIEKDAKVPGYSLITDYSKEPKVELTSTKTEDNIVVINTYSKNIGDINIEAILSIKNVDTKGNIIPGSTFELYNSNKELIATETTDENGLITFDGFKEEENYILKIISVPKEYSIKDSSWNVNVFLKNDEPELEYDEKTNYFNRIYEWDLTIDSNKVEENTLVVVSEKVSNLSTIPLTGKNNYILYIVIILIGLVGFIATLCKRKVAFTNGKR